MIEGLKLPGLSGKVAVVTGANRGIGEAIALELARNGADIVLTARDPALLETAAGKVRELGARAATVAGDLSKPDFPASVADEALRAFGNVDILVNNAGATKRGDFLELTDSDWADGFELKFFGAVRMCRTLWPELVKTKGCVINIGGAGGRTPDKPFTIGSSVNAAVMAFTKALADLGMTDGVRVNLINPGLVRTERLDRRIDDAMARQGLSREAAEAQLTTQSRTTRIGEAEDIAAAVAWLCSGAGVIFHGALIDADAGYTKGV